MKKRSEILRKSILVRIITVLSIERDREREREREKRERERDIVRVM